MSTILRLLDRVPTFAWVLLAATQAVSFFARLNDIVEIDDAVVGFANQPAYFDLKSRYGSLRQHASINLIAAAVLFCVFTGLAVRKWSSRTPVAAPESDAEPLALFP